MLRRSVVGCKDVRATMLYTHALTRWPEWGKPVAMDDSGVWLERD
jgi:hypothetical protein